MSIRSSLLVLLLDGPAYASQLRSRFEERTGGTWPLNVGQVFQTLDRLVRDGLVIPTDAQAAPGPAQARTRFALTGPGRQAAWDWLGRPVARAGVPRDELAIKVALALATPGVDVLAIIDAERRASMAQLAELTARKRALGAAEIQPWVLVAEKLAFDTEAQLRWLEHCRTAVERTAGSSREHPRRG